MKTLLISLAVMMSGILMSQTLVRGVDYSIDSTITYEVVTFVQPMNISTVTGGIFSGHPFSVRPSLMIGLSFLNGLMFSATASGEIESSGISYMISMIVPVGNYSINGQPMPIDTLAIRMRGFNMCNKQDAISMIRTSTLSQQGNKILSSESTDMTVFDLNGRIVKETNSIMELSIDSPGMYIVRSSSEIKKFIIQ